MRKLIAIAAVLVLALAVTVAGQAKATTGLKGEVGPGFDIEVKKGNRDLKTIKAGKYSIKIEDDAAIHNFHLKGPGLNKKTGVAFKGDRTWKITLKKGTYTYQCDPHASSGMKGTFKVT
jgi:plastocyanin